MIKHRWPLLQGGLLFLHYVFIFKFVLKEIRGFLRLKPVQIQVQIIMTYEKRFSPRKSKFITYAFLYITLIFLLIYLQELIRLQDVLNAREVKLVEYSKQNISLQESISVYRKWVRRLFIIIFYYYLTTILKFSNK